MHIFLVNRTGWDLGVPGMVYENHLLISRLKGVLLYGLTKVHFLNVYDPSGSVIVIMWPDYKCKIGGTRR